MDYDVVLGNPLYDENLQGSVRGFQLGLLYLSTYVEKMGYKAKVLAGEGVASKLFELITANKKTPLIGLYVSADNIQEVERVCLSLKNEFDDLKIILGGPEAKVDFHRLLKHRYADFVCTGDGEECLYELLEFMYKNKGTLQEIPFLSYLDNGNPIKSKNIQITYNLDKYPIPDRSMYEKHFLNPSHIATARGCASECTFCYEGLDKKIRRHSVDRIIEELKYLTTTFGTKYFSFVDDTFTTDRRKIYKLCDRIDEVFLPHEDLIWYCEAKVSDIEKDPALISRMVKSGLARMQFGSESGEQYILDSYKKEIQVEQIYKTVEIASETELVSMFTNMIIGGVHETESSFSKTLEMAKDLIKLNPGVVECSSTFLSPYSGTDVRLNPSKYGIEILDKKFISASSDSYIFAKSKNFTKDQVLSLGKVFFEENQLTMQALIPSLPVEKIKRQIQATQFGLTTTWYKLLSADKILKSWESMFFRGYLESYDLKDNDALFIPFRTFELESIIDSTLVWGTRGIQTRFSDFEMYLVEMASGKISLREIVDSAFNSYWQRSIDKEKLRKDIISFYNQLADNLLLMFRKFR